jgi:transcription factor E2F7/8
MTGEDEEDADLIEYSAGDIATTGCPNELANCTYSRKEKSLGELCRRFLGLYGCEGRSMLYLDQCTKELCVERRRIYDIINILESFQVINRQAKNAYQWKGINKIVISIDH